MNRYSQWTRSIATRLSLTGCVGLFVVLATVTTTLGVLATKSAREAKVEFLLANARGVANALDAIDLTSRSLVERFHPAFVALVGSRFRMDEASGDLYADDTPLHENFTAVDRFKAETGGVATVFARSGDDFIRVSTSVKKQDGSRALGTALDKRSAAYARITQGLVYSGRSMLFGKPFMTHYEPVKDDAGKVVGATFIGFEISVFDDAVADLVRSTRFFDTGGIYLVEAKGNFDDAVIAMHPTLKGKRLAEALPGGVPFYDAIVSAGTEPIENAGVLGKAGHRWSVAQRSASTGLTVVAEVNDDEAMRSHWEMLVPFGALLMFACVGLGVGLLVMTRRWVARPLNELAAAAREVAAGNLTRVCTSQRDDDIGRLTQDVESMRRRFLDLLRAIRTSADSIATASVQIASGNKDLSARTEHAASSLQETASSMEQITSTVRHTADSARSATGLAGGASRSATQGGVAMREVVVTMEDIHRSARKISDISGVIDAISFQTNLLALNAAVEAARAGPQGRGFAVVAAEVRALAQRSAASAKEIRELIDESVRTVAAGATIVQGAGETMTAVVSDVHRVSELIANIAESAGEQSAGITQINSAVGQLDALTQQNAALVEQSAAAAQSLQDQAVRLTGLLEEFSLEETA